MKKTIGVLCSIAGVAAALLTPSGEPGSAKWVPAIKPALADAFPATWTVNGVTYTAGADGRTHIGCWAGSGSTPTALTNQIAVFNALGLRIQMNMAACDADVDMRLDNFATNGGGFTPCTRFGGDFATTGSTADVECEQFTVSIDPATTCPSLQAIWCHEMGHSMGLGHQGTACMTTFCNTNTSTTYDADHLTHLGTY